MENKLVQKICWMGMDFGEPTRGCNYRVKRKAESCFDIG